jgi:tripeptidyl-peptidase-1
MFANFKILAFLVTLSLALQPFEERAEATESIWTRKEASSPQTPIRLQIALTSPNEDAFAKRAVDIGTPGTPYYRQHLSPQQLSAWFKPKERVVNTVQTWLKAHNIESTLNADILEANTTIEQAEDLLRTKYHVFQDSEGYRVNRVEKYFIPEDLEAYIDFVTPTVCFPLRKRRALEGALRLARDSTGTAASPLPTSKCDYVGPACQREIYNITYEARAESQITFGLYLQLGGVSQSNIDKFLKIFNNPAAKANATVKRIEYDGGDHDSGADGESAGDTETSLGLAWPLRGSFYATPNLPYSWGPYGLPGHTGKPAAVKHDEDLYFRFLHELAHNKSVPHTLSTSEAGSESAITTKYARRLCRAFAQLGTRGVSVVWPTGDFGASIWPRISQGQAAHARFGLAGIVPFYNRRRRHQ